MNKQKNSDLDDRNLCFVQWFETLDREKIKEDAIDEGLDRARLRLQITPKKLEVLSAGPEFPLVSFCSIREMPHMDAKDPFI